MKKLLNKEFFGINVNKYDLYTFIILASFYFISYFNILTANYLYGDDLGRAVNGYLNFGFGRFTSDNLAKLIYLNKISDIKPLTQIISILLLSLTGVILIKIINNFKGENSNKINLFSILSVMLIGLFPFFLETISFTFDTPYMTLSILISIFPFLFLDFKKEYNILFIITSIIAMVIMWSTYQASSSIYPIITLFICFLTYNSKTDLKKVSIFLGKSIFSYVAGTIAFKVIWKFFYMTKYYRDTSIIPLKTFFKSLIENYVKYYSMTIDNLTRSWLFFIFIIFLSFVIIYLKNSKNKMFGFIKILLLFMTTFLLMFGVYPLLEKPMLHIRALYEVIFPVVLASLYISTEKKVYIPKIILIALVYSFVLFSFIYGNVLKEQKRYTEFVSQMAHFKISEILGNKKGKTKVYLEGDIGYPKTVEISSNNYKVIKNILIPTFKADGYWENYYFYKYYNDQYIEPAMGKYLKEKKLYTSVYFDIYQYQDALVLVLKERNKI